MPYLHVVVASYPGIRGGGGGTPGSYTLFAVHAFNFPDSSEKKDTLLIFHNCYDLIKPMCKSTKANKELLIKHY